MTDIAINMLIESGHLPAFDIRQAGADLQGDDGLETAVVLSLFSDRLAETDDALPDGSQDRRGWWADGYAAIEGDRFGSRLWLLGREKQTGPVLLRAEEYAHEALAWLLEDGIASAVRVRASIPRTGWLQLAIEIDRPDLKTTRYSYVWEAVNAL